MLVRVTLAALTRLEWARVVEVPDNISEEEVDALIDHLYDEIDGGDYTDDPDYWEKGDCYVEMPAWPKKSPDLRATLNAEKEWTVVDLKPTEEETSASP